MSSLHDCRAVFANTLEALADADSRIVAVCNDSVGSSNLLGFKRRFEKRLINVGIAEQNLIGIGAGLANGGKIPFVCGASCFLTARALEQIKADMAYSQANVKLCGMSSGVAYGPLGPTHHSIEDIAWTRVLSNLTVIVPADPLETEQAVKQIAVQNGPFFLRVSRFPVPVVHGSNYRFQIGKCSLLRKGTDVTLIANGVMVPRIIEAAALLQKDGIEARVLNMPTVRPIDVEAIVLAAKETEAIVTVEEHSTFGGLGSAVAEVVVEHAPVRMRMLGFTEFAPTGSVEFLFEHFGLTPDNIKAAAVDLLRKKRVRMNEAVLHIGD